ncbi:MAG: NERD domain-containing protein [Steroidobacteraceae bacterium]
MTNSFSLADPTGLVVAAAVAGLILGIVAVVGYKRYRVRRDRRARESRIASVSVDYLRDVALPDASGTEVHLDYLLLTTRGLLLLDVRDIAGNVFGSDSMTEWTVMAAGRRFTFANPQAALYDRIAAVKGWAGTIPVEGRVVFSRAATFPKGLPRMTLREESLEADFLLGERGHAERVVAPWMDDWQQLKATARPSRFQRS